MSIEPATTRARMPAGTEGILNARTLAASHRRLASMLAPGMAVLDAGCGPGAITRGVADATGGLTVGFDASAELLDEGRAQHGDCATLHFVRGDLYNLPFARRFDIV